MKSKFILVAIIVLASVSTLTVAYAQNSKTSLDAQAKTDFMVPIPVKTNIKSDDNASVTASTTIRGNATNTESKNNREETKGNATSTVAQNKNASTTKDSQGKSISEEHRSVVATLVQNLLSVADREGGIGPQVRVVAQSQNDSASTTATAMTKVENRGAFHVFLTGSDYKNLGVIRSEIATTSTNIDRLKNILEQTTDDTDRAELSVQIKTLEDEQAKVDTYVKANEDRFSLFGWFARLFAR